MFTYDALIEACRQGSVEIVGSLLPKVTNINFMDGEGDIPLSVACYRDNEAVMRLLFNPSWTVE